MFDTYDGDWIEWRFGSLLFSIDQNLALEVALCAYWNADKFKRGVARAQGEAAGQRPRDSIDADDVSKIVFSQVYWARAKMLALLSCILVALHIKVSACPCHACQDVRDDSRLLTQRVRLLRRQRSISCVCPLSGRQAPLLATGMVRDLLDRLSEQAGAEVLLLCVGLLPEDRTSLLADWEAGKSHVAEVLQTKTSCWEVLPLRLCGLGHVDNGVAQGALQGCLQEYAAKPEGTATHLEWVLLDPSSPLRPQVVSFLERGPSEDTSVLSLLRAKLALIPLHRDFD